MKIVPETVRGESAMRNGILVAELFLIAVVGIEVRSSSRSTFDQEMMAAGLWSTPSDIARFAIDLMNTKRGYASPVISVATGAKKAHLADHNRRRQGPATWCLGAPFAFPRDLALFPHWN